MGANTQIEWCDATLNLWWGCTKVSAGCMNCYAEGLADKRLGRSNWGPKGTRQEVKSWRSTLGKIARNAEFFVKCAGCDRRGDSSTWEQDIRAKHPNAITCCPDRDLKPARPRVFVQSMSDTFEGPETMGGNDSLNWAVTERLREDLSMEILRNPELDFLILTKRPENILRWAERCMFTPESKSLPDNVWIGTSVEDQATADARVPHLLEIPAKVRFLSMEPLLGPVDLRVLQSAGPSHPKDNPLIADDMIASRKVSCLYPYLFDPFYAWNADYLDIYPQHATQIHWVIVGGESGKNARPMHPGWVRSLRDQCVAAGVPFFFKQWGEWGREWGDLHERIPLKGSEFAPGWNGGATFMWKVGKKKAGRMLDGRTWDEFPGVQ